MRMPCPGPSGETLFFASPSAICFPLFLKRPGSGLVESVVTLADQRFAGGVVDLSDLVAVVFFVADFFAADFFDAFPVVIIFPLGRLMRRLRIGVGCGESERSW